MKCEVGGSNPHNTVKEVNLVVTLNVKMEVRNNAEFQLFIMLTRCLE